MNKASEALKGLVMECGVRSLDNIKVLGKYIHVSFTNAKEEANLRELFANMQPASIRTLPRGADGKHMDGFNGHRIVVVL